MQTMWLLGGLGVGAGLMYLLDPEKGAARRDVVREYVGDYGRQTGDLLDDTRRALRRRAQTALARTRVPFRRQPGLGERLRIQTAEVGLPLGSGHLCIKPPPLGLLARRSRTQAVLEQWSPAASDSPIAGPASRSNRSQDR
jgi:hypothetical protein